MDTACKNTRNVRRFMLAECGETFSFNRPFMAWIRNGSNKTMGDVADAWLKQQVQAVA